MLADRLGSKVPAPDGQGRYVFDLAGDMRLGVEDSPAGGLLAWSEAAPAPAGDEAEDRMRLFLRLHLARLRHDARIMIAGGGNGELLLHMRLNPDAEREWLDAASALLNETEALRKALGYTAAASGAGGGMGLFAGMSDLFKNRP
jgi:hypothetical protein